MYYRLLPALFCLGCLDFDHFLPAPPPPSDAATDLSGTVQDLAPTGPDLRVKVLGPPPVFPGDKVVSLKLTHCEEPLALAAGNFQAMLGSDRMGLAVGCSGRNVNLMRQDYGTAILTRTSPAKQHPVAFLQQTVFSQTNTATLALAAGRIDGDAYLDLVVANGTQLLLLKGIGEGSFQPPVVLATNSAALGLNPPGGLFPVMTVGDLNGDLVDEIVLGAAVLNGPATPAVALRLGSELKSSVVYGSPFSRLLLQNFGNSSPDLVMIKKHPGGNNFMTSLFHSDGKQFTGQDISTGYSSSSEIRDIAVADFDEDGKADLAIAHNESTTGKILLQLGQGGGSFSTVHKVADVPNTLAAMITADFNNDAFADLAVLCNGQVLVYAGKGNATFTSPAVLVPPAPGSYALLAADFDQDGKVDLAVTQGIANLDDGVAFFVNETPL